ncbi:MAG TPA: DUF3846 domain-containing protein [Candidatus Saccharimonadales bacterium]|nr:DUF3846 domain-containing protein [Candidatus Saccharimonadales bacterium]
MERENRGDELPQISETGEALRITTIVVPADEEQPLQRKEIGAASLDDRQQIVGGYIEAIRLRQPPSSLYVNEEGKLQELPLNRRASMLLWVHHRGYRYEDYVAGDAFLTGPIDREGSVTNVPDQFVATLFNAKRFRAEVQTKGDRGWHGNDITFATWEEAYSHVLHLGARWTQVEDIRVIPEA